MRKQTSLMILLACFFVTGCADSNDETAAEPETTPTEETTALEAPEEAISEEPTADATADEAPATENKTETAAAPNEEKAMASALSYEMETLAGEKVALSKYDGKVVLFVNVASQCGLTPQYEQLQALHEKYADKGLAVVGFPCNQFGGQEPGSAEDIQKFCSANYGVEFDMMAKVEVNGDGACDLYKYLTALETAPQGAGNIGWNFEKFLISRSGEVVNRFSPRTSPEDDSITTAIETALAATP